MKNILVLIDIQKEYTTEGRPFCLNGIEPSLVKCRSLLDAARKCGWDIIHIQHSNGKDAQRFNPDSDYFKFVEGFEPLSDEKWYVKNDFSCYSNSDFADYIDGIAKSGNEYNIYLIGYNSVMCCLSTMEEARRKAHKICYIEDASYAKAIEGKTESESHQFMVSVYKAKNLAKITSFLSVIQNLAITTLSASNLF